MKAPKGHYRTIIGSELPSVRIAFTHTPIHGCVTIDNTKALQILDASNDPYAKYYADGLRSGEMVTIVERSHIGEDYLASGELYFKS